MFDLCICLGKQYFLFFIAVLTYIKFNWKAAYAESEYKCTWASDFWIKLYQKQSA